MMVDSEVTPRNRHSVYPTCTLANILCTLHTLFPIPNLCMRVLLHANLLLIA